MRSNFAGAGKLRQLAFFWARSYDFRLMSVSSARMLLPVLVITGLAVAACSSGTLTSAPPSQVCPQFIEVLHMLSPTDGASNVSPSVGKLSFSNAPPTFSVTLTGSDGTKISSGVSFADGSNNGSTIESVSIPQLAPHTTYSVSLSPPINPNACNNFALASSFSTQ